MSYIKQFKANQRLLNNKTEPQVQNIMFCSSLPFHLLSILCMCTCLCLFMRLLIFQISLKCLICRFIDTAKTNAHCTSWKCEVIPVFKNKRICLKMYLQGILDIRRVKVSPIILRKCSIYIMMLLILKLFLYNMKWTEFSLNNPLSNQSKKKL